MPRLYQRTKVPDHSLASLNRRLHRIGRMVDEATFITEQALSGGNEAGHFHLPIIYIRDILTPVIKELSYEILKYQDICRKKKYENRNKYSGSPPSSTRDGRSDDSEQS